MGTSSSSLSARCPECRAPRTSRKGKREDAQHRETHLLIHLIWKRSIIHILSRDWHHTNSHSEMEWKSWGKERRGDSICTTTYVQLKREATQANTLSRWSRSREKRHCLWTLKSDCSIPGQSGHGMKQMTARPCWGCRSARRPAPALPAALLAYGGTHTVTAGRRPPAGSPGSPGSPPGRSRHGGVAGVCSPASGAARAVGTGAERATVPASPG